MKKRTKWWVILTIVVLLLAGTVFDYFRSKTVSIEVVSISPETVVADSSIPVDITLRVTKRGKLAVGDDIAALVEGKGSMSANKSRVDENGLVTFRYYPYNYLEGINEAGTVTLVFRDISDSVFIGIPKRIRVDLDVEEPENLGGDTMDSLFGE